MNNTDVKFGLTSEGFNGGVANNITLCVTEECNLRCKYCYMTSKNNFKRMSFETAKSSVDYVLNNRDKFNLDAVVWDFIGGEPFLEIDLIDKVCDYIKQKMYLLNDSWFHNYIFSFTSNGLLYDTPKVQNFINKNKNHISIGISVDGNKIKHDLQRVYPDGRGSYDDVIKNVPLWLEQFGYKRTTKATFAHGDIEYLKDSIISLWNAGIKDVSANIVYEDVWDENDPIIFEEQLKSLADYVLENDMWKEHSVRFFDPTMGLPLSEESKKGSFCGAGKMLAVDCDGKFFPCIRFLDFTLNNRPGLCTGSICSGLNENKLKPFESLTIETMSPEKCLTCNVASGCSACTGFNYDDSKLGTIFERATHLCEMHKANARANEYFWNKFREKTGIYSMRDKLKDDMKESKFLQILLSDNAKPHCNYINNPTSKEVMPDELLDKGIEFAQENNMYPVFIGNNLIDNPKYQDYITITDKYTSKNQNIILIHDNEVNTQDCENNIILINKSSINKIHEYVTTVANNIAGGRINLILQDIENWDKDEFESYDRQLDLMINSIKKYTEQEKIVQINVLTDLLDGQKTDGCGAGTESFTLAPNGKLYICPAFYFENKDSYIGDLEKGIDAKIINTLKNNGLPYYNKCNDDNCKKCVFLNKKLTNELSVPSNNQCLINSIEEKKAKKLDDILKQLKTAN